MPMMEALKPLGIELSRRLVAPSVAIPKPSTPTARA
jgi:hypothetical protein